MVYPLGQFSSVGLDVSPPYLLHAPNVLLGVRKRENLDSVWVLLTDSHNTIVFVINTNSKHDRTWAKQVGATITCPSILLTLFLYWKMGVRESNCRRWTEVVWGGKGEIACRKDVCWGKSRLTREGIVWDLVRTMQCISTSVGVFLVLELFFYHGDGQTLE